MAVGLQATYSKKLGLPQFSSHQFTVSVQSELTDLSQVPEACGQLHALLQDSVDREIRKVGWLPDANGSQMATRVEGAHESKSLSKSGSISMAISISIWIAISI